MHKENKNRIKTIVIVLISFLVIFLAIIFGGKLIDNINTKNAVKTAEEEYLRNYREDCDKLQKYLAENGHEGAEVYYRNELIIDCDSIECAFLVMGYFEENPEYRFSQNKTGVIVNYTNGYTEDDNKNISVVRMTASNIDYDSGEIKPYICTVKIPYNTTINHDTPVVSSLEKFEQGKDVEYFISEAVVVKEEIKSAFPNAEYIGKTVTASEEEYMNRVIDNVYGHLDCYYLAPYDFDNDKVPEFIACVDGVKSNYPQKKVDVYSFGLSDETPVFIGKLTLTDWKLSLYENKEKSTQYYVDSENRIYKISEGKITEEKSIELSSLDFVSDVKLVESFDLWEELIEFFEKENKRNI